MPPFSSKVVLHLLREALAVEVLAGHDRDVRVAVGGREVGEDLALETVGRGGTEVEPVVLVGVEARGRVGRRELHDAGAGDLVDDADGHTGRGGTDDGVDVVAHQLVDLATRDVGGAVTGVGLDVHDILAEDSAGGVDVLDRQVDARELGRAEEGEVTGLREQRADGEDSVTGRRCRRGLGVSGARLVAAVVVAAACGQRERHRRHHGNRGECALRANQFLPPYLRRCPSSRETLRFLGVNLASRPYGNGYLG